MEKSQEIRNRIKSISGTRKITKAMEMIASSKIRRAQNRILEARAFISSIEEVITDVACYSGLLHFPLLTPHENDRTVLILGVTADRGLCGGYNSNIVRLIEKTFRMVSAAGKTVKLDIIGIRGRNYFRYMGYEIEKVYENLSDYPKFLDAREISREIISRYLSEQVDRVIICYTRFKNPAEQIPSVRQLLPIPIYGGISDENIEDIVKNSNKLFYDRLESLGQIQIGDKTCRINPEFLYDPSPADVIGSLLPQYIYTIVYGALLEATASETGARMTAMKSASDNAEEMIKDLVLMYHRARQQQITMEIAEIVSGAQALATVAE
ncbi:MAG: ATP synthase F1 subunit gamma [Actinobacteria bacterium]|nr:ATP synthase F1 subunit gamma [Actinomycetota bacterium]